MENDEIVALYWTRSERAIAASEASYGAYCRSIARRILGSDEDAEEIVNDTWVGAWQSIPPARPACLAAYLGKLTRRLSLSRLRERHAQKRGTGAVALALHELEDCVSAGQDEGEARVELRELSESIDRFLAALPDDERRVFLCRYWYLDPVADISARFGFSGSKVKSMLYRTRQKLRLQLQKEGYFP